MYDQISKQLVDFVIILQRQNSLQRSLFLALEQFVHPNDDMHIIKDFAIVFNIFAFDLFLVLVLLVAIRPLNNRFENSLNFTCAFLNALFVFFKHFAFKVSADSAHLLDH